MDSNAPNIATQTMFAELTQRALDSQFDELYDERGTFLKRRIKTREYWYYSRSIGGQKHHSYVGPVGDKEISSRVRKFETIKSDYRQRRALVRGLAAMNLPTPDPMAGAVIETLWKGGFFRLRGVLVGTLAYQCYSGILGIKLSGASLRTSDADLAQFYDVSHMVNDSMPPILDVLHRVDKTFEAVPGINHNMATRFRTQLGYLVEFLTPNRGSDENQRKPAQMPALGGASAQPLRYLDYLIHDTVWAVVLHKGGIPVRIPSPERYAIHKLIVATQRKNEPAKTSKDIAQAERIIRACLPLRSYLIFEAWTEACERGPSWRRLLKQGRSMLNAEVRNDLIFNLESHGWSEKSLTQKKKKAPKKPATKKPAAKKAVGKKTTAKKAPIAKPKQKKRSTRRRTR